MVDTVRELVGVDGIPSVAKCPGAHGWGTHHEMRLLVEAGLTPLEALSAGTGNGARILEADAADFGTIAVGHVADLLLLDADPSIDIGNSRKIARVMQRGQWVEDIAPSR